eukprot:12148049-Prorocentrum_lima.AAC.1
MWWMQHYLKVQDLLQKENLYRTDRGPNRGGQHPKQGPREAKLPQPAGGNVDWNKMPRTRS